eukprot:206883_1
MSDSDPRCSGCNEHKGSKTCSGCKQTYYCSIECQKSDWSSHKTECKRIRKQRKKHKQLDSKQTQHTQNQSLASSMAENMRKQYDKENKKRRTPRIKVTKAINGIFKVKLLNEFLRNKQSNLKFQFQFDYKLIHDTQWNCCHFTSVLLDSSGVFCVRMPLHLNGYHIKCRLRAHLILEEEPIKWFDFSKAYRVSIPSSMIATEFDIGDIVRYKEEDDYVLSWTEAEIVSTLSNGYLTLKEIRSANTPPQLAIKTEPFILHASRVALTDNVSSRHLLDLSNLSMHMDKILLLKLNDNSATEERMNAYKSLVDVYTKYAMFWKALHSEKRNFYVFDVKVVSIAKFVAVNVMQYLYEIKDYEWKIDNCVINDKDGALKCLECLRAYFIRRNIEEGAVKNEMLRGRDMDGRFQICDVCSVSVDQFEYIYHCSARMEDRHDICLTCVYSMIKQSGELSELLVSILSKDNSWDVNCDCVQLIVSFVVGKVVKIS